jgi:two-component system, NtrC family, response regulator PilR
MHAHRAIARPEQQQYWNPHMAKRLEATPRVLVIDDEPDLLTLMRLTLTKLGLEVVTAESFNDGLAALDRGSYSLCLTDMQLGDGTGLDIIAAIQRKGLDLPCAVITAFGNADNAVAAIKAGAFDYLAKPVSLDQLRTLVKSAIRVPEKAVAKSNGGLNYPSDESPLVGESASIVSLRSLLSRLAKTLTPVHIHGESGTGKELAARILHQGGPRAGGPFIAVNCGAIPETLMESEFFGYRKGAFTGADTDGTLFLDEVADLPLTLQVKLLRVIQEKRVRKVGASIEEDVDVRIVSATHKNLNELVVNGKFRQDLFYRLNVLQASMPPLREIRGDIPVIARKIVARFRGDTRDILAPDAVAALGNYAFPGNVRELENVLERAIALAESPDLISAEDLRLTIDANPVTKAAQGEAPSATGGLAGRVPLQDYLDRCERETLELSLAQTRGNRTQAAKLLGITFRSMRYRLERLGMRLEDE